MNLPFKSLKLVAANITGKFANTENKIWQV